MRKFHVVVPLKTDSSDTFVESEQQLRNWEKMLAHDFLNKT